MLGGDLMWSLNSGQLNSLLNVFFPLCKAWTMTTDSLWTSWPGKWNLWENTLVASVKIKTYLARVSLFRHGHCYLLCENVNGYFWQLVWVPWVWEQILKKKLPASFHPTVRTSVGLTPGQWHQLGPEASVKLFSHSGRNMCVKCEWMCKCWVLYVDARWAWSNMAVAELNCL